MDEKAIPDKNPKDKGGRPATSLRRRTGDPSRSWPASACRSETSRMLSARVDDVAKALPGRARGGRRQGGSAADRQFGAPGARIGQRCIAGDHVLAHMPIWLGHYGSLGKKDRAQLDAEAGPDEDSLVRFDQLKPVRPAALPEETGWANWTLIGTPHYSTRPDIRADYRSRIKITLRKVTAALIRREVPLLAPRASGRRGARAGAGRAGRRSEPI